MSNRKWDLVITPKSKWWDLKLGELWDYKDLILILVRRDVVSVYKQTILGPLWFFLSPIFTVVAYNFVFNNIAGISTDGIPGPVFYLSGTTLWGYFAACFGATSNTFRSNASVFGKVYFPRLIAPIATIVSNLLKFGIQMLMFLAFLGYYMLFEQTALRFTMEIIYFPLLVVIMGAMALGVGIIFSTLTTKYRDLSKFIGFGISLLMYITPVIYPLSAVPTEYETFVRLNPISPVIEMFRLGFTGVGTVNATDLVYSGVFTAFVLIIGMILFHKVERTFMDTV